MHRKDWKISHPISIIYMLVSNLPELWQEHKQPANTGNYLDKLYSNWKVEDKSAASCLQGRISQTVQMLKTAYLVLNFVYRFNKFPMARMILKRFKANTLENLWVKSLPAYLKHVSAWKTPKRRSILQTSHHVPILWESSQYWSQSRCSL